MQIDTDVCEEKGFDVLRRENGVELSPDDLAERVSARLRMIMGEDFCQAHADKLFFAITVNSTECWLLPLLYPDRKAQKISGCLAAANHALKLANRKGLASEDSKYHRIYDEVSRPYSSSRELNKHRHRNPSLARFVRQLEERFSPT